MYFMTTKQENKLSMFLAVKDYLNANVAILSKLPNYLEYFALFENSVAQIQSCVNQQRIGVKGVSSVKKLLRNNLIIIAVETSRRLMAYAKFSNNQILLRETMFSEGELKNGTDSALWSYTQGIYDLAQSNLSVLSVYGITTVTQAALHDAITAFVASIPKPRLLADKKQNAIRIANYFDIADVALDGLDTIIEIVRMNQSDFYNGYKVVRKHVEMSSKFQTVKGFITDATTGEPLRGVKLSFRANGRDVTQKALLHSNSIDKDEVVLTKRTAEKGWFNIRALPEGIYNVTVKKYGYKEQVVSVKVMDGELCDLNVELHKN